MLIKIVELIKNHYRGFLIGVGLTLFALFVHSCDKKHYAPKPAIILPPNDKEIINVQPNKVTVTTNKGTQTITGSRDTKVEVKKDGTVVVTEKTMGLEHQIGADVYGGKEGLGVGLDLRFAYYKNFDALTGIGYLPTAHKLDLWLGCSYTIHNSWMSNTAVYVGYSATSKAPVAGVSLRF